MFSAQLTSPRIGVGGKKRENNATRGRKKSGIIIDPPYTTRLEVAENGGSLGEKIRFQPVKTSSEKTGFIFLYRGAWRRVC